MPVTEITLAVCPVFFSFLFAEHYLHVSGDMAVASAGIMMCSFGRTRLSASTLCTLMETWEQPVFRANSLVFFLVGLLINRLLIDIDLRDIINLGVLVAAALGARALVLYGTLPLMSQFAKDLVSAGITRLLLARVDNLLYVLKSTGVGGYQLVVQKTLQFGPAFRIAVALYTRCLNPAPCTAGRESHRAVDRNALGGTRIEKLPAAEAGGAGRQDFCEILENLLGQRGNAT